MSAQHQEARQTHEHRSKAVATCQTLCKGDQGSQGKKLRACTAIKDSKRAAYPGGGRRGTARTAQAQHKASKQTSTATRLARSNAEQEHTSNNCFSYHHRPIRLVTLATACLSLLQCTLVMLVACADKSCLPAFGRPEHHSTRPACTTCKLETNRGKKERQ